MLRPLLASVLASALVLIACSKSSTPADGDPTTEDPVTGDPDGTNGTSGSAKKKGTSSSGGTSGGASTSGDPGTGGTSGGTTTPPPANTVSDKVDISEVKLTVNGEGRRYLLAVPKNYDESKAYPLIVALHGDGGNADEFVAESKITMASTDQAIVAFPDQVVDLFTTFNKNNDQRLVANAIAQIKGSRNIDDGKVWGFGYSKGAFMLNELACRKAGLFTAIAPHAGGAPVQEQDDDGNVQCPNAQAINVFATMGTNDDLEGGQFEADYWAEQAGCGGGTTTGQPNFCQSYKNCNDAKVSFCKIANHGHFPLYDTAAADSWAFFTSL